MREIAELLRLDFGWQESEIVTQLKLISRVAEIVIPKISLEVIPDFRFSCARPNLLMLSEAFIDAGSDTRKTPRRVDTQWVKNKTGLFSSVSTDF